MILLPPYHRHPLLLVLILHATATAPAPVAATDGGGGCQQLPLAPPSLAAAKSLVGWASVKAALDSVDDAVEAASKGNNNMGVGVVVSYRGELVHVSTAGAARYNAAGAPVMPDYGKTLWRIGSVTKVFTALAMLVNADRGRVSLDASVRSLLPEFTLSDDITLRSLATQLSGMTREEPLPCHSDESRCNVTTAELLPEINRGPLLWPPNVRPAYSNLGFGLLGHALEPLYANKKAYEAIVEDEICAPLGMQSSGFSLTPAVVERLALGRVRPGERPTDLGWANPDGGMHMSLADMETFLAFLTGGGGNNNNNENEKSGNRTGLISSAMHREWFLPRMVLPDGISGIGMPWEMLRRSSPTAGGSGALDRFLFTKAGNIDRFGSLLTYEPNSRLGIWVVANAAGGYASQLGEQINNIMYAAFDKLLLEAPRPSPPQAAAFAGVYKSYVSSVLSNMTITVSSAEGQGTTAVFQWDGGGPLPASLYAGPENNTAVLHLPTWVPIPCIMGMELAWEGELAIFDTKNRVLTLPGLLTGAVFTYVGPPRPPPAPGPPSAPPSPAPTSLAPSPSSASPPDAPTTTPSSASPVSPVSPAPVHCRSASEWRTLEGEKAAYQRATAVVSSLLGAVLLAGGFAYYYYRVRGGARSSSGLLLGGRNSELLEL